jgi:hypothetical protein
MWAFSRRWRAAAVAGDARALTGCDTAPQAGSAALPHHRAMARSQAQSDFVFAAPPPEVIELPEVARALELPRAEVRTVFASARATKWVLTFVWIVLGVLTLLCAIGPHIPAGE